MDKIGTELNKTRGEGQEATTERTCLICGCTDSKACVGGCYWALPGICSKCILVRVPAGIEQLVEVILETHQDEIDRGHYGDKDPCSTCELIEAAQKIVAALQQ